MKCTLCPELVMSRKRICRGDIMSTVPAAPRVMVVAESPGRDEDNLGTPLVGTSGQEARHHISVNGISGRGVYLTNVVLCHPPDNRDPTKAEIATCTETYLIPKILELQPDFIISMGRISTQWFLGPMSMELVHGIPRPCEVMGHHFILIPTYHPAAGLHSPELAILFQCDMRTAGDVIRGRVDPHPPHDEFEGVEDYRVISSSSEVYESLDGHPVVAVDTEWAREAPFCLSYSVAPGTSWVVKADQSRALAALNDVLRYGHTITAIHNAAYDLPVLGQMGVVPTTVSDTMVMAYLLQDEPQGLKPLSFRHCGMKMNTYSSMVEDATWDMALQYVLAVAAIDWPTPEPVLEWKKGEPYVRQPQSISMKLRRIIKSVAEKGDNPWDKWKAVKEGKEVVERVFGPMQEGELCDIPWQDAVQYSARDADATIRIYPILWNRIQTMGLEDTFWRDMRMMPMVVDMMANGMPVNLKSFAALSVYFQSRMDYIQRQIQATVGHHMKGKSLNPGSYPQMSELLYDRLALHLKGGSFKSKKANTKKSTSNDILMRYVGLHPVVQMIMDWREYQKLKTSYADTIPRKVKEGRIHTTLRITRVATGRLSSSNPNLMAQPTRSEEGRKVRDCYETDEDHVLISGDYGQVEMRTAASDAQDLKMMDIFWKGVDIHSQTASDMFGIRVEDLDEMKHRYPAKRVGFGILNLITAEGLQRELSTGGAGGWTVEDCQKMIKAWFDIYKGIAAYMKANGEHARRYGYVRDMWGRIRYIPGIRSNNKWVRIEAERQAGNAPIQMSAQGVIKEAMGRLVPVYRSTPGLLPLIQIHDDIVWQSRKETVGESITAIKRVMESSAPRGFLVPLEVDFKVGRRWGSMDKWKTAIAK